MVEDAGAESADLEESPGLGLTGKQVLLGGLVAVVLVAWVVSCMTWLPYALVHENRFNTETDQQTLEDKSLADVRTNLLAATAGLAIIVTGYFTWRRVTIEEDQARSTRNQVATLRAQAAEQAEAARRSEELTREGQITERYSRAIEQLGQQDKEREPSRMDIRIGGIYALERIALDAEARNAKDAMEPARDHQTVVEVLSRFIRTHIADDRPEPDEDDSVAWWLPNADVDAALQVLGRQSRHIPAQLPRLSAVGVYLYGAYLRGADLEGADLRDAGLGGADLFFARLGRANLGGADLGAAFLNDAFLNGANLHGANLMSAQLKGAYLRGADLEGAELLGADLEGADLRDAYGRTDWDDLVERGAIR